MVFDFEVYQDGRTLPQDRALGLGSAIVFWLTETLLKNSYVYLHTSTFSKAKGKIYYTGTLMNNCYNSYTFKNEKAFYQLRLLLKVLQLNLSNAGIRQSRHEFMFCVPHVYHYIILVQEESIIATNLLDASNMKTILHLFDLEILNSRFKYKLDCKLNNF